jgi:hypothetical protein
MENTYESIKLGVLSILFTPSSIRKKMPYSIFEIPRKNSIEISIGFFNRKLAYGAP